MGHGSHLHRHAARADLSNALDDFSNLLKGGNDDNQKASNQDDEKTVNDRAASDPATVVSVVYYTASPTFTGAIAGYSTQGPVIETTSADSSTAAKPQVQSSDEDSTSKQEKTSAAAKSTSKDYTNAISAPATTLASSMGLVVATRSATTLQTSQASNTALLASATSSASPSTSGGMSAAGKAGIVIGVLLLFAAILSLILFCFKKRKDKMKRQRIDEEKNPFGAGAASIQRSSSTKSTPNAPRLSLRPVTQFLPNYGEKRNSQNRGIPLATTGAQEQNKSNPFGNHAEAIDATNANGPPVVQGVGSEGEIIAASAAGAAAGAATGLKRGASKRGQEMDFTKAGPFRGPPSPSRTVFSETEAMGPIPQTNTGAAIAAAGGPQNTTVHRVQLDFKPSMEDELELRAGQLIRLLHEYDDGWAMCIRLDRSQQGVCPRTCLSTRPVKPRPQQNGPRGPAQGMRPQGPPRGKNQGQPRQPGMNQRPPRGPAMHQGSPRPMSPAMNQSRPMSPAMNQSRPASPAISQGRPRSMSPAPLRPMTPTAQQGTQAPTTPQGQQGTQTPVTPQGQIISQGPSTPIAQQAQPTTPTVPERSASPSPPVPQDRQQSPAPTQMNLVSPNPSADGVSPISSPSSTPGPPPSLMIGRKPVPGQAL